MRNLQVCVLLLACCGCGDGAQPSRPEPEPGIAGEAGLSGSGSESEGGRSGPGGDGGASGSAEDGGSPEDASGAGGEGGAGNGLLPDEPDNGTLSGTRLKAEWYDFGGTRVFADFYDTALEVPCTPGAWSDGKVYCIPVSSATLGYTSDSCTELLGQISVNAACARPSPRYLVLRAELSPCSLASAHVYRLAATATGLTQYYAMQNGGCAGPFSTGFNSDTFLVTGEVMPSELVELTREALADPGRLSRQYLVASDGARLAIAPHDRELDADCSLKVALADPSKGACPPTDTKDVVFHTDMGCETPVVSAAKICPKPAFARQLSDPGCAQGQANYYSVADAVQSPKVFVGNPTACVASSIPSTSALYALGDPVTVQQLTRAHDDIPGRTVQPIYFSDGAKRYLDSSLYDTAHDTECQVNVLPDGTIVCVPFGSSASVFYGDDTCAALIRVGLVYFGAERCDAPPLPPFIVNPGLGSNGCTASYEIRERGPEHAGKAYLNGGTCEPDTALEPYHLFELGDVRPFSEFPTGTKVRDP